MVASKKRVGMKARFRQEESCCSMQLFSRQGSDWITLVDAGITSFANLSDMRSVQSWPTAAQQRGQK